MAKALQSGKKLPYMAFTPCIGKHYRFAVTFHPLFPALTTGRKPKPPRSPKLDNSHDAMTRMHKPEKKKPKEPKSKDMPSKPKETKSKDKPSKPKKTNSKEIPSTRTKSKGSQIKRFPLSDRVVIATTSKKRRPDEMEDNRAKRPCAPFFSQPSTSRMTPAERRHLAFPQPSTSRIPPEEQRRLEISTSRPPRMSLAEMNRLRDNQRHRRAGNVESVVVLPPPTRPGAAELLDPIVEDWEADAVPGVNYTQYLDILKRQRYADEDYPETRRPPDGLTRAARREYRHQEVERVRQIEIRRRALEEPRSLVIRGTEPPPRRDTGGYLSAVESDGLHRDRVRTTAPQRTIRPTDAVDSDYSLSSD